jgi:hypothetical protein
VLRNWVKGFEADPQHSFPGLGRLSNFAQTQLDRRA